jgi:hypothetical protein
VPRRAPTRWRSPQLAARSNAIQYTSAISAMAPSDWQPGAGAISTLFGSGPSVSAAAAASGLMNFATLDTGTTNGVWSGELSGPPGTASKLTDAPPSICRQMRSKRR